MWAVRSIPVYDTLFTKDVREVNFAEHHDESFDTGEAGVRESGLLEIVIVAFFII